MRGIRSIAGTRAAAVALAVSVVCCACSSPSNGPGGTGGGAGRTGGTSGAGGGIVAGGSGGAGGAAVPACNQLAEDATSYGLTWDTDAAPDPQGGTFADGTYVVTRATGFETSMTSIDPFGRDKVSIAGTTWQEVEGIPPYDVNPDRHYTRTMAIAPPHFLTLTRACPAGGGQTMFQFTANAGGFSLFHDEQGTTFELVYTRQ